MGSEMCIRDRPTGTDAVIASTEEIANKMPGLGPKISNPIIGRYGGEFYTFGDYSVNLFENYEGGIHKTRPLFDMAAVAIVKNSSWAKKNVISAPCELLGIDKLSLSTSQSISTSSF